MPGRPPLVVTRSQRPATLEGTVGTAGVIVLVLLPYLVDPGFANTLVNLFILVAVATMWTRWRAMQDWSRWASRCTSG